MVSGDEYHTLPGHVRILRPALLCLRQFPQPPWTSGTGQSHHLSGPQLCHMCSQPVLAVPVHGPRRRPGPAGLRRRLKRPRRAAAEEVERRARAKEARPQGGARRAEPAERRAGRAHAGLARLGGRCAEAQRRKGGGGRAGPRGTRSPAQGRDEGRKCEPAWEAAPGWGGRGLGGVVGTEEAGPKARPGGAEGRGGGAEVREGGAEGQGGGTEEHGGRGRGPRGEGQWAKGAGSGGMEGGTEGRGGGARGQEGRERVGCGGQGRTGWRDQESGMEGWGGGGPRAGEEGREPETPPHFWSWLGGRGAVLGP